MLVHLYTVFMAYITVEKMKIICPFNPIQFGEGVILIIVVLLGSYKAFKCQKYATLGGNKNHLESK